MTELLTSKDIQRLTADGYSIQFTGKKLVEFEGSKCIEQYYRVDVENP